MQRWLLAVGAALLLIPTAARAQHYGSTGVTVLGIPLVGAYKYPAGVAPGYGYSTYSAPVAGYGYAAPGGCFGHQAGYGFAAAPAAGYGYAAPMMAAPSGCTGYTAGYGFAAPMSGFAAAGPGPAYGYGPPTGYGPPQAGLLTGIGGLVETIRALKEIRDAFEQFRGGSGGDGASGADIRKLQKDVADLSAKVEAMKFPPNVTERLDKIDEQLLKLSNVELQKINKRLTDIENNPKLKP
jgi:hypothetical protein